MEHAINKIYLTASQINIIITELARKIEQCYFNAEEVTCVIVLDGAKSFGEDLLEKLSEKFTPVFIEAKSYVGERTQANVQIDLLEVSSLLDREVLLIDDIYDTGKTLSRILRCLEMLRPKSLKTCVLLNRVNHHEKKLKMDFVGKEVLHKDFLVGYGLDYDGTGRNWPYIVRVYEDKHSKEIKEIIGKNNEKTYR